MTLEQTIRFKEWVASIPHDYAIHIVNRKFGDALVKIEGARSFGDPQIAYVMREVTE